MTRASIFNSIPDYANLYPYLCFPFAHLSQPPGPLNEIFVLFWRKEPDCDRYVVPQSLQRCL